MIDVTATALPLERWSETAGGTATLINVSENLTYRIDSPSGDRHVLRVHRPDYHSVAAVESELAWMQALRADLGLFTPRPMAGRDGRRVQSAPWGGTERHMVLFAFETGAEPQPGDDLAPIFAQLGALAAQCHAHVQGWQPPAGFVRHAWTVETILDPGATWGDWRGAPGVADVRETLDRLDAHLRDSLGAYGRGPDRFGLIHADMRLANLLVEGGETRLLDFDDSGFGWFGYDFAAGISFYEDDPNLPALAEAWMNGYRRHRDFAAEHQAMLPGMVMLRRLALLAWIGTHPEVDIARELAPRYAAVTAELAERHLAGRLFA